MNKVVTTQPRALRDLATDAQGGGFVEYMIIVGCVALLCIAAFTAFGGAVTTKIGGQATSVGAIPQ